jgi:hypothetical protein
MFEFLLIVALIGMTYLWYEEKRRREDTLEEYVFPILRDHNNLREGLHELHNIETRAMDDMDEAVKNGR